MQKIQLLSPEESVKLLKAKLYQAGFRKVSKSGQRSFYFTRNGTFWKARVSDHRDTGRNDDVIVDIVFDSPTTVMDVDFQFKAIQKRFDSIRRA